MTEQRRLVTVVFADVVGSTALAEELDAEDVRALLTRYYVLANEVVTAHGGIVAKLLGDGVLACFGIPSAHGDDAQRAIDAALALRGAIARDEALERLRLRIGVNTGEVLANEDASGEIVGDAVNVAARVASAADEGEILVADATHRASQGTSFGEGREIAAKGKSQPVRVWPVLGRATGVHTSTTPFVGREDDLAQLELVARRAFRDRRPYLVTLTAPTGAGKSRLVEEFHARLATGASYAHAHCPPYGETLAYGPLRELLLGLLGLSMDASPDDVRRTIGDVLAGATAARDAMLVAATIAPEANDAQQDRDAVFAAWRTLVTRLATERPLVIVLEDLQNASDSLLDLIEQVAQPGVEAPLLFICLARPELLQRRPSWGGGRRNSLNLTLEPLTDDEIATLVTRLLESRPPAVVLDRVVERSAGNPFFAEELVRSIIERRVMDLRDVPAVTDALRALPETVQATLLSRIDMLPPEERAVLQSAAVVGRTFDTGVVAAVCDLAESAVSGVLARLVERDLVSRTSETSWAFRNALVRDVAYGMLPRARRARDHALIAARLERDAGERIDERAGTIGMHYLEATRLRRASALASPSAEDEVARSAAVRLLARAASADANGGAWGEAIAHLHDAVTIATDAERVGVLAQLAETASGGDIGWDASVEALRLWRARPERDPAVGARIITGMLFTLFRAGVSVSPDRLPDAPTQERLAQEALDLARQSGDELVLAPALTTHASLARIRALGTHESLDPARDEAAQAVEILERRGAGYLWSIARDAWAAIVGDQGDIRRADEITRGRIAKIETLPSFERAHANWTVPLYAMPLGDVERARVHIERAITEPGFVSAKWAYNAIAGQMFLVSWRAAIHWALGEWDACIESARFALTVVVPGMPDSPMRSLYRDAGCAALYVARRRGRDDLLAELGPMLRRWCDDPRSLTLLDDDPSRLDAEVERVETAGIDVWQVERSLSLLAAYGRVPVTSARLDRAIAYAEPRGLRPLLAQLLRLRARVSSSPDDARRAHELLAACGMRADAALAAAELARLGDRSLLGAARVELEQLGDLRGLASLDA